jgi:hypothetical protein
MLRTIGPRGAMFAAATALGISAAVAQVVELPEGPGKAVVLRSCVDCHDAGKIAAARHSPNEWETVVSRMIDNGAALSLEEQATAVKYLSANLGPAAGSSPAATPTQGPSATPTPPAPATPTASPSQSTPAPLPATRPSDSAASSASSAKKPEGAPR